MIEIIFENKKNFINVLVLGFYLKKNNIKSILVYRYNSNRIKYYKSYFEDLYDKIIISKSDSKNTIITDKQFYFNNKVTSIINNLSNNIIKPWQLEIENNKASRYNMFHNIIHYINIINNNYKDFNLWFKTLLLLITKSSKIRRYVMSKYNCIFLFKFNHIIRNNFNINSIINFNEENKIKKFNRE